MLDFYKILRVPRNAATADIEEELEKYEDHLRAAQNNTFTMSMARRALEEIVPALHAALLSGVQKRAEYDEKLRTSESPKEREAEDPTSHNLDKKLRRPFFYDLDYGFDTEPPSWTLREIATRFDKEWETTRNYLLDKSHEKHLLVLYLTYFSFSCKLAEQIEQQVIQKIQPDSPEQINLNEAVERCILLLNPEIERPSVTIHGYFPHQQGTTTIDAGSFLPTSLVSFVLRLSHAGPRGCAYGKIVSRTPWMRLVYTSQNPPSAPTSVLHFALGPEIATLSAGPCWLDLRLVFEIANLQRCMIHRAQLVISVDNYEPPMMIETGIAVNVLSIPPRILFEAERMEHNNLLLPELTRGETAWVHLVAKNQGDEALHPLVARLFCQDKDVSITPQVFHTNEPVLIRVSTTQRPFGSSYTIELQVDYSLTKGAMGPARLFIQGSVRPTIWQSMLREVSLTQRLLIAVCLGGLGFMITGEMSIALAALSSLWALLVFPMVLLPVVGLSMNSILFHRQRAGKTPAFKHVFWLKLASGLASGTLLDVIYRTLDASVPLFLVGGIIGGLIGCIAGFISDIPAKI